jgi:hypothetical protein
MQIPLDIQAQIAREIRKEILCDIVTHSSGKITLRVYEIQRLIDYAYEIFLRGSKYNREAIKKRIIGDVKKSLNKI